MADGQPLASKNSMFWRPDPAIAAARKHPGWALFHRCCGDTGLAFDDIEKSGRGYSCLTFRHQRHSNGDWSRYRVSDGSGRTVIEAVLSAFDAAVAAGWPVDPSVRDLLTTDTRLETPAAAAPVVTTDDELDDLLGDPPATDAVEDWELI